MATWKPTNIYKKIEELASKGRETLGEGYDYLLGETPGGFEGRESLKRVGRMFIPNPRSNLDLGLTVIGGVRPSGGIFKSKILKDLATTPERQSLLKKVEAVLTDLLLNKQSRPEEAYLFGSYATKKPIPSDIDVFAKYPKGEKGNLRVRGAIERLAREPNDLPLHYIPDTLYPSNEALPSLQERLFEEGIKRYGSKDAQWIKILTLLGLLSAATNKKGESER